MSEKSGIKKTIMRLWVECSKIRNDWIFQSFFWKKNFTTQMEQKEDWLALNVGKRTERSHFRIAKMDREREFNKIKKKSFPMVWFLSLELRALQNLLLSFKMIRTIVEYSSLDHFHLQESTTDSTKVVKRRASVVKISWGNNFQQKTLQYL